MALTPFSEGNSGEDPGKGMAEVFGPGQVDQAVRQAIHFCWMMLPKERKNLEEVEKQVRRIVERALRDFRDDSEAFGRGKEK
jgi:hypothetical protein